MSQPRTIHLTLLCDTRGDYLPTTTTTTTAVSANYRPHPQFQFSPRSIQLPTTDVTNVACLLFSLLHRQRIDDCVLFAPPIARTRICGDMKTRPLRDTFLLRVLHHASFIALVVGGNREQQVRG